MRRIQRVLFIILGSVSVGAFLGHETLADQPVVAPKPVTYKTLVTMYVMGDVPYAAEEDVLLPKQIAELPDDCEFVVHVGDIKRGSRPCNVDVYAKVSGMLSKSAKPVFIIPGDNEWNDCRDPDEAWKLWVQHFMRFDERWRHGLQIFRQAEHEENFAFAKNGVLFLGINLQGGRIHDSAEWKQRHADNVEWMAENIRRFGSQISRIVLFGHAQPKLRHVDFFAGFVREAESFGKPVLYIHGDGHNWQYGKPFNARNILKVMIDRGGIASPLKLIVTDDPERPFLFDRRKPVE